MALAQAFIGLVCGPFADMAWEAAEIGSAIRDDRKPANDQGGFELGAKKSLGGIFSRNATTEQSPAELERAFFRPLPAFDRAFRLQ